MYKFANEEENNLYYKYIVNCEIEDYMNDEKKGLDGYLDLMINFSGSTEEKKMALEKYVESMPTKSEFSADKLEDLVFSPVEKLYD